MVKAYLADLDTWCDQIDEYGADTWLICMAIINEAKICETSLGIKIQKSTPYNETIWRQQAEIIFKLIALNKEWWQQRGAITYPLPLFGTKNTHHAEEAVPDFDPLIERCK